uniref:CAF1B/HIR1 beta-propeller domain-containing protein n=1 Tax=Palpitomonas bilix TaxID=652834 RepID=A0A7S3CZ04_9EUKA
MKLKTLEVNWHGQCPIYAVDFHPHRHDIMVTAGQEPDGSGGIKLWSLRFPPNGEVLVEFLRDLSDHPRSVNAARFSPSGKKLVTAGDEGTLIVWQHNPEQQGNRKDDVSWANAWERVCLHTASVDVYDVSWSPTEDYVVSGSIDRAVRVWSASKGGPAVAQAVDSKGYVQGVAWDPRGDRIVSLSTDRTMRAFVVRGKQQKMRLIQSTVTTWRSYDGNDNDGGGEGEEDEVEGRRHRLYVDESLPTFVRRLSFSPDGSCLVTPSGQYVAEAGGEAIYTTYLFSTSNLSSPLLHLPCGDTGSVCARFNPLKYKSEEKGEKGEEEKGGEGEEENTFSTLTSSLDYTMIFAVASENHVAVYDTSMLEYPICTIGGIHMATLTDLAWHPSGRALVVSSRDGFISIATFDEGELGDVMGKASCPIVSTSSTSISASPPVSASASSTAGSGGSGGPATSLPSKMGGAEEGGKKKKGSKKSKAGKSSEDSSTPADKKVEKDPSPLVADTASKRSTPSKGDTPSSKGTPSKKKDTPSKKGTPSKKSTPSKKDTPSKKGTQLKLSFGGGAGASPSRPHAGGSGEEGGEEKMSVEESGKDSAEKKDEAKAKRRIVPKLVSKSNENGSEDNEEGEEGKGGEGAKTERGGDEEKRVEEKREEKGKEGAGEGEAKQPEKKKRRIVPKMKTKPPPAASPSHE